MAGLNLFTNNAASTLASSINTSVTSLTVASGQGTLFPNPTAGQYFYCTLSNTAGTIIEIVKVTARSTDTFTIVRGQDNTTASAFSAGDKVELRLTAADLQNFPQLDSTNTFATTQTFTAAPVFTDATGTRSAISAAKSGANSDITSITGLTTALTVAQGGTGVTTSTGTGSTVLSTSPTLTTPNLGTPSAATLTNATGLPLSTGVTGTLPIANGGTNNASLAVTAGGVLYTDGSKVVNVGAGTSGQVLQSNGASAPTWATVGGGGLGGMTVFTANGTFTIPSGKTVVKVTVVGGGGGSSRTNPWPAGSSGGGGAAIKYLTGLTPGNTLTVTRGAGGTAATSDGGASGVNGGTGGTSSVSSGTQTITTISATGGIGGDVGYYGQGCIGGAGGTGSNGDLNLAGGPGGNSNHDNYGCSDYQNTGPGGNSILGGGGAPAGGQVSNYGGAAGTNGGGATGSRSATGGTGGNGVIIFEY